MVVPEIGLPSPRVQEGTASDTICDPLEVPWAIRVPVTVPVVVVTSSTVDKTTPLVTSRYRVPWMVDAAAEPLTTESPKMLRQMQTHALLIGTHFPVQNRTTRPHRGRSLPIVLPEDPDQPESEPNSDPGSPRWSTPHAPIDPRPANPSPVRHQGLR